MAWIPIFVMGVGLFVIEQSIQDVDVESDEFPQNIGRFFVAAILIQRPEISNISVLTLSNQLSEVPNGVPEEWASTRPDDLTLSRIRRGGLEFQVEDLEFVINMSDEKLKLVQEVTNSAMWRQLRQVRRIGGRSPTTPLVKQSFSTFKYSQKVAADLIEFDHNGDGLVDFRELVDYMRPTLWSEVLFLFFRLPQAFTVVIVIGMVAPKLISRDMKNRAFLLYYSRPISPWQYLLGKCAVVWAFLAGLTTLPALLLYILGLSLSPDMTVFFHTWQLPLRILLASIVLCVPTTLFALMLSSLTRESRRASFAWFAGWIMGSIAYTIMTTVEAIVGVQQQQSMNPSDQAMVFVEAGLAGRWAWLSPMQTLENMQSWVFGIDKQVGNLNVSFIMVGLVCLACLAILRRRIDSPIRV